MFINKTKLIKVQLKFNKTTSNSPLSIHKTSHLSYNKITTILRTTIVSSWWHLFWLVWSRWLKLLVVIGFLGFGSRGYNHQLQSCLLLMFVVFQSNRILPFTANRRGKDHHFYRDFSRIYPPSSPHINLLSVVLLWAFSLSRSINASSILILRLLMLCRLNPTNEKENCLRYRHRL